MKTFLALLALVAVALAAPNQDQQLQKQFTEGNHKFSASIYKVLKNKIPGNFLVCPISVEVIMALTQTGAKGATLQQLAKGLNLPESKTEVEALIKAITPSLRGNNKYSLSSANKIFVKQNLQIVPDFKQTAVQVFDADIENVDFTKKAETVGNINQWVEKKTNSLIKNLISQDDVNEDTLMILINALYFKGRWESTFEKYGTSAADFFTAPNKSVKVQMMRKEASFKYFNSPELDAQFLQLPYEGGDIIMTIALPNKIDGLAALEDKIEEVFKPKEYTNEIVRVELPKFEMESTIQFKEVFQALGVDAPFTDGADFSGITKAAKIDKIIQKTKIKVDEEGTEAAAATADIELTPRIPSYHPRVTQHFIVNRPFFYSLHVKNGITLFTGRTTTV